MTGRVLVDTGPIVAMMLESDEHHQACVEQLRQITGPLMTCWPVITEAVWLLRAYPKAIRRLLSSFQGRPFELVSLGEADLPAVSTILAKYDDLGLQLADAALVHLANREGIEMLFTLDRRDFGVVRLAGGRNLRLIP